MPTAFSEGYYAGLAGDDACPFDPWHWSAWSWRAGNELGLAQWRATIEAVVLHFPQD